MPNTNALINDIMGQALSERLEASLFTDFTDTASGQIADR